MANPFKKCSWCGKRRRGTNVISLTPSPYEFADGVEVNVTIEPQPPTKLCRRCITKIKVKLEKAMNDGTDKEVATT